MSGQHNLNIPKPTRGDHVHTVVRAGLSAIPAVGGPTAELFNAVIQPPLSRRRDEWMESVGEKLQELEARGVDVKKLSEDEAFVSAVLQATTIAMKTHQREKLDALHNAVLNTALKIDIDEQMQEMFLSLMERFTATHLHVLKAHAVADQDTRRNKVQFSQREIAQRISGKGFLPLGLDGSDLVQIATEELCALKFLVSQPTGIVAPVSEDFKQVTSTGDRFLKFVAKPPE
jgi:hypothetical protein